jgi:tRNA (cytosine34-C5)-methyltransferase
MGGGKTRIHKRRRTEQQTSETAATAGEEEVAEPEVATYLRPGESEQGAAFEAYYRKQRILPAAANDDEAEWQAFFAHLHRPLPVTFRINEGIHLATLSREAMETGLALLDPGALQLDPPCDESGRPLRAAVRLSWCNGWQLGCSAGILKRPQHAHWAQLNDWLIRWAALGVVSRQAIDSMAPVSLLGIEPHHVVLDLCASPGSKTQQVLDAMHAQPGCEPTGLVVANDWSPFRARMLVRRCAALGRAAARIVVVSHAAQHFPDVSGRVARCGEGAYDRIVCDVPCCGDGTFRKNPEAWNHWRPSFAQRLHGLQIDIALRGLALLRVGGEMAYSTCALNPIEDEAVVAELLRRTAGAIELVDVSGRHPLLRRREGLRTWRVIDDEGHEWRTPAAVHESGLPQRVRNRFHASMWPPEVLAAGAARPPLERCVRLLPGMNETGGFFVALLRKTRPWPPPRATDVPRPLPAAVPDSGFAAACANRRAYGVAPEAVRALVREATGVAVPASGEVGSARLVLVSRSDAWAPASSPAAPSSRSRACVMCVAPELRAHALEPAAGASLRVVRCGFKFAHTTRSGALRLSQPGAEAICPAHPADEPAARVVRVSREEMVLLLNEAAHALHAPTGARHGARTAVVELGEEARRTLGGLTRGPCIVVCPQPREAAAAPVRGVRGRARVVERESAPQLDIVVPAFFCAPRHGQPRGPGGEGEGSLRIALTHEPGLENLPRAYAAYTYIKLSRDIIRSLASFRT